jgi:hypothetical protein
VIQKPRKQSALDLFLLNIFDKAACSLFAAPFNATKQSRGGAWLAFENLSAPLAPRGMRWSGLVELSGLGVLVVASSC